MLIVVISNDCLCMIKLAIVGFNSVPNLIVISSIIFPCMHVGLFVRDECEKSVKNQASKGESVEFATSS